MRYEDKDFDKKNLDIKILSNILPKNVRIEAENLLRNLVSENVISIQNNGEDMLRCIFIRNSSIKKYLTSLGVCSNSSQMVLLETKN